LVWVNFLTAKNFFNAKISFRPDLEYFYVARQKKKKKKKIFFFYFFSLVFIGIVIGIIGIHNKKINK
jgi:hypothetical protein